MEQQVNGEIIFVQEPLTLDNVLHLQSGDHILQNMERFSVCKDLFNGLEISLRDELQTVLLHDTLIHWEDKEGKRLCPDIAVSGYSQTSQRTVALG